MPRACRRPSGQARGPAPTSSSRTRYSCSGAASSRRSGRPAKRCHSERHNACTVVTAGCHDPAPSSATTWLRSALAAVRLPASSSGPGPSARHRCTVA
ncbi:MAG: hypothetical protein KDB60_10145 [Propionibacteriaceae bacterium]|nr:hypothetical protein [Propionibacteriaceae bacterium]